MNIYSVNNPDCAKAVKLTKALKCSVYYILHTFEFTPATFRLIVVICSFTSAAETLNCSLIHMVLLRLKTDRLFILASFFFTFS